MTQRTLVDNLLSPTLAEFKKHIRLTDSGLDDDLMLKLRAAIYASEHEIGQVIAVSDFVLTTPFNLSVILPEVPLISVASVEVDGEGVTGYTVDGNTVILPNGTTGDSVVVTYRAGMSDVPYDIKAAILLHATALFNNPEDSVETLTKASHNLLRPYRLYR